MEAYTTSREVLTSALQSRDNESTRTVLKNPDLFAFVLSNFNNTIKLVSGKPTDMVIALSNKTLTTGKIAAKSSGADAVVVGLTAAQILVTSASLITVAGKGPTGALLTIGAAFAKKTSLALGLATDDKQAKCMAALADMAASGLTTAALVPVAGTGIGAVVLAGSIAQLILSGYQVHQACLAK